MVVADGVAGRHGEDFVERADAAWQSHDHVAVEEHQVLAVGEVVAGDVHGQVFRHAAALLDDAGHHADEASLFFGQTAHQAHVAATEHDGVAFFATPACQFGRALEVFSADVVVSRAENSYFHDSLLFLFSRFSQSPTVFRKVGHIALEVPFVRFHQFAPVAFVIFAAAEIIGEIAVF